MEGVPNRCTIDGLMLSIMFLSGWEVCIEGGLIVEECRIGFSVCLELAFICVWFEVVK